MGIDFDASLSPVAITDLIKMIIHISCRTMQYETQWFDETTAYLNGTLEEYICIKVLGICKHTMLRNLAPNWHRIFLKSLLMQDMAYGHNSKNKQQSNEYACFYGQSQ